MNNIFSCLGALFGQPIKTTVPTFGTYPAVMYKMRQMHLATTTHGHPITLKGPSSDVEVHILSGTFGTLVGHVELDPVPYLKYIPKNECIIAAIPDFEFSTAVGIQTPQFQIKLRHTLQSAEDLNYIQVRHGDIRQNKNFELIPHKDDNPKRSEIFWEADINFITITTTHFSQFLCTSCKKVCDTRLVAYVTGAIKEIPGSCTIAETVLFMCPHQFTTKDYETVSQDYETVS